MRRKIAKHPEGTLATWLRKLVPQVMDEFDKAPWDYNIYSPISMDDVAIMTVYLKIGTTKQLKQFVIEIDLLTNTVISIDEQLAGKTHIISASAMQRAIEGR